MCIMADPLTTSAETIDKNLCAVGGVVLWVVRTR